MQLLASITLLVSIFNLRVKIQTDTSRYYHKERNKMFIWPFVFFLCTLLIKFSRVSGCKHPQNKTSTTDSVSIGFTQQSFGINVVIKKRIQNWNRKDNNKTTVTWVTGENVSLVTTWVQKYFPSREKLWWDESLEVHTPPVSFQSKRQSSSLEPSDALKHRYRQWTMCSIRLKWSTADTASRPHIRTKTTLCPGFGLPAKRSF